MSLPASATEWGDDEGDIDITTGDTVSEAASKSYSNSTAGSDSNSSNYLNIEHTIPKSTTVRNVASPDTPNVYPSAPCRIARSAGLSLAGGSLSGGSSVEDIECTLRETARTFQYLGVPEVGLYLMCQQSIVVNGRYDKKNKLEAGTPTPIGSAECLRLVREFQGDVDVPDVGATFRDEIEGIREQQNSFERQLTERIDGYKQELEKDHEDARQVVAARPATPAPIVTEQIIQQPYLNDEKRAKLAALIGDTIEETAE